MTNKVCLRTLSLSKPRSLDTYLSIGGYSSLINILSNRIPPSEIIQQIKNSGLRGRGGAGFPTGTKWGFISRDFCTQKYVVCNSDEGEPGTCKDREILRNNPHQIIEGMAIAGYVMSATIGYNYVRAEYYEPIDIFEAALLEAQEAGFIGKNIRNSGIDFELYCSIGAGSYVCEEETALLNSLEGKKGFPRLKPPFPATNGLYGCPTNVNNTETYASVPVILQHGSDWFSKLGYDKKSGTKIFCISGHVNKPIIVEVGLGIPFQNLLAMAGGVKEGFNVKAVIPGGSSSKILSSSDLKDLKMNYEDLSLAGSMLGSGGVVVLSERTCMVKILTRIVSFYHEESCGQCTPCREGTGWMLKILNKILENKAKKSDVDNLVRIACNIEGNTICALGEAVAWPVQSYIEKFKNEFYAKIKS